VPISRIPFDQLPEAMKPAWVDSMDRAGEAEFIEVGAHAPELITWYRKEFYERLFYGGRVDVRFKELLRLRLSKAHGCWY